MYVFLLMNRYQNNFGIVIGNKYKTNFIHKEKIITRYFIFNFMKSFLNSGRKMYTHL